MVEAWTFAFLVTLSIEGIIYIACPLSSWRRRSHTTKMRDCFLIHCFTHPMVFFVFAWCFGANTLTYLTSAEAFAIGVEGLWLACRGYRYAFVMSVAANLASWLLGGPLARALWTFFQQ